MPSHALPAAPPPAADDEVSRLRARLAELERHVDEIQSIAALGSYQWFVQHDRIFWSAEQLRIHGLDASRHPRTLADFLACIHPDDRDAAAARVEGLLRDGRDESCYRIVRPDGVVRTVQARSSVVRDAAGAPLRVVGTVQDVTRVAAVEADLRASNERLEQRVAERTAALQRREEHFRRLIENGSDLLMISAPDLALTYVSPSVERLLGYTPDEMLAKRPEDVLHPDDVPHVYEGMQGILGTPGTVGRLAWRIRHRDGGWRLFDALGRTIDPHSADAGVVCNGRDVTNQHEAELALQRSEEHFRALIEHSYDLVQVLDPRGKVVYTGPSVQRLLGYTPEEVAGGTLADFVHPDDLPAAGALVARVLATPGESGSLEYRVRHKDGSWRWFEAFARTLSATSAEQGIVANARDITDRREAERALRESEEYFRRLIENGNELLVISAADGTLTYVSPSAERLLGYTPEEMLGQHPADLLHPDDVPAVHAALRAMVEAPGTSHRVAERMRHKDGSWRHIDAIGRTLLPHSAADGLVCSGRDVTEQRAAEEALQRREEHFRRLIENGSDLLMVSRVDGPLTYVSPSAERMLGHRPADLIGRSPSDLIHPDDVDGVYAVLRRIAAAPGTVHDFSARLRHRDGGWRLVEALGRTVSPDSADEGIVANSRDVTEQRAAEAALQRSEEHFRRLIENGSDLLLISEADGPLTYVSPSAERLLGYTPGELLGMTPHEAVHPDDVERVMETLRDSAATPGAVRRVAWRVRHKDGGLRTIEALARTLAPDSADAGIVINGRDVTEQRAAAEALRRATAEAEQARAEAERANQAKSEFLSRMSHELRTPLNSILGFAQVLEDLDLPPEYRGGVRHILNGGRHLLDLINEVLDIARIESGHQPLSIEPVRVDAVIREAVDMVRPLAAARGVWVGVVPHPADARYVRADRQRLTQVLLNLLSNAVKYNRPAGAVRIGVEPAPVDGGERLRVRVSDEGAGIAPAQQGELFVPFARLGAEHTGVEGTGLGLALSQRLAHAMGATLFLERSGAGGSVFAVDLAPAADPLAGAPAFAARAEDAARGPRPAATLLYIEDNLANLSLVETILLPHPEWRLIPALQGGLGLELAAEHAPDVVLLDLHLPDMHGRDVLRRLRADPRTARVPVVVISADATPRTVEALTADGADDFLTKPLDVRAFLATVERLLARPR